MPAFDALLHKSFFAFLLGSYVSLITVINPASKVPLFVSLTSHLPAQRRRRIAGKACLYALAILVISLFAGGLILEGFGISYGALRIAGGLVVAVLGYRMLFGNAGNVAAAQSDRANIAFYPLALPGISGPGTIAVVIGLSTEIAEIDRTFHRVLAYSSSVLSIVLACLTIWLVLRSAARISRLLGPDGTDALTRLMGFLLICIGVQFIGSGVRSFVAGS